MALTILGRYNLGGSPYYCSMPKEGHLYYRPSNGIIRKAIWNVSDANFAAVPVSVQEPVFFPASSQSLIVNNQYCVSAQVNGFSRWCFVDIDTAAVSSFVGTISHAWSGRMFTDGTNIVSPGNTPVTTDLFTAQVTPPAVGETITAGAGYVNWGSFANGVTVRTALFYDRSSDANFKQFMGTVGNFEVTPGGLAVIKTITPQMSGAIGAVAYRGAFSDTRPEDISTRKSYSYSNTLDRNLTHVYGFVEAKNNAGVVLGAGLYRTPIVNWPNMNIASEYNYPLAGYGWGSESINSGVHINQKYNKIYMQGGTLSWRLQHAKLDTWPPVYQSFLDLDSAWPAEITGIWTFPPFVYIAKTSGPSFTHQLIKLLDTDLMPKTTSRRSGSEIWEMIPEVGQYLL